MSKKIFSFILSFVVILPIMWLAYSPSIIIPKESKATSDVWTNLKDVGNIGYSKETGEPKDLKEVIGWIINYALSFLGVIFLVLILYSGYQWMVAGGNSDAITAAKERIVNATIGLAIVIAAYSIVWFVMKQLTGAISGVAPTQ